MRTDKVTPLGLPRAVRINIAVNSRLGLGVTPQWGHVHRSSSSSSITITVGQRTCGTTKLGRSAPRFGLTRRHG